MDRPPGQMKVAVLKYGEVAVIEIKWPLLEVQL